MKALFWLIFSGVLSGLALALGVMTGVSWYIRSRFSRHYGLLNQWQSVLTRVTWRDYFEANLRAETGKPLDRPYGAHRGIFSWDQLQFRTVYLTKKPLRSTNEINSQVILGPLARKPLLLEIPLLIGGMAYGGGYSIAAKVALAKAASLAGTAANSGNGPFLPEERQHAAKYILQYSKGFWSKSEADLQQADMIEIALGHSARGSAPVRIAGKKITPEVADKFRTIPGLDVLMEARLPEVETIEDWRQLVCYLKEVSGGVPIGVKFGASQYLEEELDLFIKGGVDVLTFDGTEGGTHGGMPLFMDDTGLPTLPALCRADRYLRERKLKDRVSLVVGGGLVTPGDFAKCLALGADAVLLGTVTALGQSHTQSTKEIPWEPPTGSIYNDAKGKTKYNADIGGQNLANYFLSCAEEMKLLALGLGKNALSDLDRSDLVALNPVYAQIAEVDYCGRYE